MANDILCNIGYMGGTHGTFLTYFLDKYSRRTPNIESSPFDKKSGTAHSKSINYSGKFDRRTFEDEQGNWRNDLNWNQNSVIILLDKESLLTFCRLSFLREGDWHLQETQVKKINEKEFSVNETFKEFFKNTFKTTYNIDLDNENCPNIILRDYLKIMFLNEHKNHWLVTTEKIKTYLNEKTITITLSEIYNTEKFLNQMKQISNKFNLELDLGAEAKATHEEFLSVLFIGYKTLNRANKVIENIKENNDINIDCGNLDIVEESYIFAWIEKNHDFLRCPLSDSFFKNTLEIKNYIKYYPKHYHPYYLHKNEK